MHDTAYTVSAEATRPQRCAKIFSHIPTAMAMPSNANNAKFPPTPLPMNGLPTQTPLQFPRQCNEGIL